MERGTVKWFDEVKGYGFITPDSGGKDLFVHKSSVETLSKSLDNGAKVEYEIGEGPKGKEAKNVHPI